MVKPIEEALAMTVVPHGTTNSEQQLVVLSFKQIHGRHHPEAVEAVEAAAAAA